MCLDSIQKYLSDCYLVCFFLPPRTLAHTKTQILKENIQKVKLSTPDYKDMDEDDAMADFMERRENYMKVYEPVTEADGPFCKIINSKQFIVNNIRGYLSLKVRMRIFKICPG